MGNHMRFYKPEVKRDIHMCTCVCVCIPVINLYKYTTVDLASIFTFLLHSYLFNLD